MIIVGYQGIGKSTLAGVEGRYIDLESGNFWVDGERAANWYAPYCNIAEHLSKQGYVVLVSSHEVVRNYLAESEETVAVVYPAPELKEEWINKLKQRWDATGLDKDYKAYMNAVDRYSENIEELSNDPCIQIKISIPNMEYSLKELITDYLG